jgi:histone H3/H4
MGGLLPAPISRVLRRAGAERVSAEACVELAEVLEDIALYIGSHPDV